MIVAKYRLRCFHVITLVKIRSQISKYTRMIDTLIDQFNRDIWRFLESLSLIEFYHANSSNYVANK